MTSVSSINGKTSISPAVGALAGPPPIAVGHNANAVNGAGVAAAAAAAVAAGSAPGPGDHSRKSSVTISAAGATGYRPNGGPVVGSSSRSSSIQFGSVNAAGSPAPSYTVPHQNNHQSASSLSVGTPQNPRISSPQTSPSPIPQPAASGGRPPAGLQAHSNAPSFGAWGGELNDVHRPVRASMPQASLGPVPPSNHLRRESSQSAHSDMSNSGMPTGPGRGGYPAHGNRGRAYNNGGFPHHPQAPYQAGFRGGPNTARGGPVMHNYAGQGAPLRQFQDAPHRPTRSPAPPHPGTPQMHTVPMAHAPSQSSQYGGYPPPNMGSAPVMPSPSVRHRHLDTSPRPAFASPGAVPNRLANPAAPSLAPEHGFMEQYLMMRNPQGHYGVPGHFDPAVYGHMPPPQQFMYPNMYVNGPPGSVPQPYMTMDQYGHPQTHSHAQPMSRTSSAVSEQRPTSSIGQAPTPSITPASLHGQHPVNQGKTSPAPAAAPSFKLAPRKSTVVIKDPTSGAVKNFDKQAPSPPSSGPPTIVTSNPTQMVPPPARPRSESKVVKTDEEKKLDMKDAIARKIEADKAEERRRKEAEAKEEDERKAKELAREREEEERRIAQEKEEAARVEREAAEAEARRREEAARKDKEEAEAAAKREAEAKAKAEAEEKAAQEAKEAAERAAREAEERAQAERDAQAAQAAQKKKIEEEAQARAEQEAREQAEREEAASAAAAAQEPAPVTSADSDASDTPEPEKETPVASAPASDGPARGASTPANDDSMGPPPKPGKVKPPSLDLAPIKTKSIEPPQPSAALQSLRSAKFIDRLEAVHYPSKIASPNPALNAATAKGRFKYNREFLMQFQPVFVEKPSIDWDNRLKDTVGGGSGSGGTSAGGESARPQSARTNSMGPRASSGRPTLNTAFPMGNMGSFGSGGLTLPPGTTSEQRLAMSNANMRPPPTTMNNPLSQYAPRPGGFPVAGPPRMNRNNSFTTLPMSSPAPQSPRPGPRSQRNPSKRQNTDKGDRKAEEQAAKTMPLTAGLDLKPLLPSTTGWKPRSLQAAASATGVAGPPPGASTHMAPDMVQRKVKAALNKMTPEKFDKISDQILEIAAQSKDETDGRTLRQVIQLTFEKATDEAHWASMYAKFCRRMLESVSPDIKDESIKDKNGQVITGGGLFRKYLLNRCQEEFERGWKVNLPPKPEGESEEAVMLSDEYYIAAAAKRRGLGLIQFIGELFKLNMLTERIMHECVKKLVDFEGVPDEAEVESLCKLLRTIGINLDQPKGKPRMDAYFDRIQTIVDTPNLPSRLRFMLMDIIDMRESGWQTKERNKGPQTIQEIREAALREQAEKEAERARQQSQRHGGGGGGGRLPPGRGDARNYSSGGQYGMMPPPDAQRNTVGMDDLRKLGRQAGSRQQQTGQGQGPVSFGPTSMFSSRSSSGRKALGPGANLRAGEESGASSRTATPPAPKEKESSTSANTFGLLAALDGSGEPTESTSPPPSTGSSPPTSKSKPAASSTNNNDDRSRGSTPKPGNNNNNNNDKARDRSRQDGESAASS